MNEKLQSALTFATRQVRATIERDPGFYPMYTTGGHWRHGGESWTHWCEGFFPGMMWLLWEYNGDPFMREQAERYSKPLESRKDDDKVHDLGFIFLSTYLPWFRATGDKHYEQVLIRAGQTLSRRFKDKGQYLSSFLAPDSVFIDIMMNVGVIFYAAGLTRDRRLWEIALNHCLTSRRYLIRGDGSSSHEGLFDLATGEFLRQSTQQGYRNDSCWSRGLAWALYGFGTAFHYSRDERFLHTAEQCAEFYLANTPGGVPPWDYDVPIGPERVPDTSAAAIAAAGLFTLAKVTGREVYRTHAQTITTALIDGFLAERTPGWQGLLRGGVYHKHKNLGVSESVIWGDYFFLEALIAGEKSQADQSQAQGTQTWNI